MISNNYPKNERTKFIKKTISILLCTVSKTPIFAVHTFYTDANKSDKAGYKSGKISEVVKSPYNSVPKAELYAILMVLTDFTEPLNIVTDSQYPERADLYIETAEFILDGTELTSLFIQLQDNIRKKSHYIYVMGYIWDHISDPIRVCQVL